MRCISIRLPLALGALLTTSTLPADALACSGLPCTTGARFAVPSGQSVPENFGELAVSIDDDFSGGGNYALRIWAANDPTRVLSEVEVKASANGSFAALGTKLVAGNTYVVEATPTCASSEPAPSKTLTFEVGPASEPPTALGPLKLLRAGPRQVPIGTGSSCYVNVPAIAADLTLDRAGLPEPWRELLTHYQLMVDGEPFSWTLTIGVDYYGPSDSARGFYISQPDAFRVWTRCQEPATERDLAFSAALGVAPGKHQVWVQARVPSVTPAVIESERVEIELRCPPAPVDSADGDRDGNTDETVDGGGSQASPAESEPDEVRADAEAHTDGCTLALPPRSRSQGLVIVAWSLFLVFLARTWSARRRARA